MTVFLVQSARGNMSAHVILRHVTVWQLKHMSTWKISDHRAVHNMSMATMPALGPQGSTHNPGKGLSSVPLEAGVQLSTLLLQPPSWWHSQPSHLFIALCQNACKRVQLMNNQCCICNFLTKSTFFPLSFCGTRIADLHMQGLMGIQWEINRSKHEHRQKTEGKM